MNKNDIYYKHTNLYETQPYSLGWIYVYRRSVWSICNRESGN